MYFTLAQITIFRRTRAIKRGRTKHAENNFHAEKM